MHVRFMGRREPVREGVPPSLETSYALFAEVLPVWRRAVHYCDRQDGLAWTLGPDMQRSKMR